MTRPGCPAPAGPSRTDARATAAAARPGGPAGRGREPGHGARSQHDGGDDDHAGPERDVGPALLAHRPTPQAAAATARGCPRESGAAVTAAPAGRARVGEVGEQVDQDDGDAEDQRERCDDREVAGEDRGPSRDPRPGSAKTFSTTTEPETRNPMLTPSTVTIAMSELRSTCRNSTRRSERPRARAASMYSALSAR